MTFPAGSPLIATSALRQLLGTPDLLVVDCRFDLANPGWGRDVYDAAHVPGAVFAAMEHDLSAPRSSGTGRHPLPSPQDFASLLGRFGFTDLSQVVVYDQASGAAASRLWWMLRARGHHAVRVLDGGWAAWLVDSGPVEAAVPTPVPTVVAVRNFEGVLKADELEQGVASRAFTLVDARAADRYAGHNETIDPVAGHVPGALNHPYTQNLDGDQRWLPPTELRRRWLQTLGDQDQPIVMMCGSGITACHNLLALEVARFADARLYAGSWSEWITDPARPVATGDAA